MVNALLAIVKMGLELMFFKEAGLILVIGKTVKEKGFKFDYLVDDTQEIAKKYGAICTPDPFLFNNNRHLLFHGKIDNAMKPDDIATEKTMVNNIKKLLSGEKIEKDFDPSIGCSIKWKEN